MPFDLEPPDDLCDEDGRLQLGEPATDAHPRAVAEREEDERVDLLVVRARLLKPLRSGSKS